MASDARNRLLLDGQCGECGRSADDVGRAREEKARLGRALGDLWIYRRSVTIQECATMPIVTGDIACLDKDWRELVPG